jgi:membrane peptidoglycan carboxypeptidase
VLFKPGQYGDPPTLRRPGWRSIALGSLVVWLGCFPTVGGLATTTPGVTALMQARESEADAAVRRNQAPAKNGPCDGIRNDLSSCRTFTPVPLAQIATVMQEAAIIGQDPAFRSRGGNDWVALRRALGYPRDDFDVWNSVDRSDLFTVLPNFRQKMVRVGLSGSLHQRIVQALWFPADDGVLRKMRELLVARRLAGALSPERTLELYLNTAEFGPGLYGVEAAAKAYFNVSAKDLTDVQAATLAATLATPRTSTPIKDPEAMRARQALILRRLRGEEVEIPTADEAGAAR